MLGFAAHAEDGYVLHGFRELYHRLTLSRMENNISYRSKSIIKIENQLKLVEKQYKFHFFPHFVKKKKKRENISSPPPSS